MRAAPQPARRCSGPGGEIQDFVLVAARGSTAPSSRRRRREGRKTAIRGIDDERGAAILEDAVLRLPPVGASRDGGIFTAAFGVLLLPRCGFFRREHRLAGPLCGPLERRGRAVVPHAFEIRIAAGQVRCSPGLRWRHGLSGYRIREDADEPRGQGRREEHAADGSNPGAHCEKDNTPGNCDNMKRGEPLGRAVPSSVILDSDGDHVRVDPGRSLSSPDNGSRPRAR